MGFASFNPSFNTHTMMFPQQPMFYNLQSYLNRHPPSLTAPALSTRQNSTTPSQNNNTANGQNIQCGRGPTSLHPPIHDKISGGHEANPNSWPFTVSLYLTNVGFRLSLTVGKIGGGCVGRPVMWRNFD